MNFAIHPIDLVAILYAAYAIFRGLRRGFASELPRLLALVVVLAVACWFFAPLGDYMMEKTRLSQPASARFVAIGLLLLGGWLATVVLRLILRSLVEFRFKGYIEPIGGGLTGVARAALIGSVVVLLVNLLGNGFYYEHIVERSVTGRVLTAYTLPFYETVRSRFPELQLPVAPAVESKGPSDEPIEPWHPPIEGIQTE